jgi:hypothetical protein
MTDPSGYAKTLALPAGFDARRLLRYDDVTAHAITRDDLGADVRGINASLDRIRETRGAARLVLSRSRALTPSHPQPTVSPSGRWA